MCFRFEDKEERQDICVETEMLAPFDDRPWQQKDNVPVDNVPEDSVPEIDAPKDSARQSELELWAEEMLAQKGSLKSWNQSDSENMEEKQNYSDRITEAKEREKSSSWWRGSGQTILRFFAKILGKRVGMAKGPTERVIPNGKMRIKDVSRTGRSRNGHKRGTADGIRLRRVSNGYIVTHVNR
jgi:hypothetical protein